MQNLQSQTYYDQITRNSRRSRWLGMSTVVILIAMLIALCSSIL